MIEHRWILFSLVLKIISSFDKENGTNIKVEES